MWSARIGLAHRALSVQDGEDFIWVWIGTYDDYERMIRGCQRLAAPEWEHLQAALDALTSLGIEVRYPGVFADAEDAGEALRTAQSIRDFVRPSLGLKP